MAEFLPAFESMILHEGGYVLHDVPGDRGGQTYAGISRKNWPRWPGWAALDAGGDPPVQEVREFYRTNFWAPLRLDLVKHLAVARTIFDFAVNAGTGTAAKLAQLVAGVTPDGRIGPKSLEAINALLPEVFVLRYTLGKLARYEQIVRRDRTQSKFLLGWLSRALKEAAT